MKDLNISFSVNKTIISIITLQLCAFLFLFFGKTPVSCAVKPLCISVQKCNCQKKKRKSLRDACMLSSTPRNETKCIKIKQTDTF